MNKTPEALKILNESRCTGHCCRKFSIGVSPGLAPSDLHNIHLNNGIFPETGKPILDFDKIYNMLIYIGTIKKNSEEFKRLHASYAKPPKDPEGFNHYYTCKHLNNETGDCMNYENRPSMCRMHPTYGEFGRFCDYADCTWDQVNEVAFNKFIEDYKQFNPEFKK